MASTDNPNPLESSNSLLCVHFDGPVGEAEHVTLSCDEPRRGRYYNIINVYIAT